MKIRHELRSPSVYKKELYIDGEVLTKVQNEYLQCLFRKDINNYEKLQLNVLYNLRL